MAWAWVWSVYKRRGLAFALLRVFVRCPREKPAGDGWLSGECFKGSPGMFGDSAGGKFPALKPCLGQATRQASCRARQCWLCWLWGNLQQLSAAPSNSLSVSYFMSTSGGSGPFYVLNGFLKLYSIFSLFFSLSISALLGGSC